MARWLQAAIRRIKGRFCRLCGTVEAPERSVDDISRTPESRLTTAHGILPVADPGGIASLPSPCNRAPRPLSARKSNKISVAPGVGQISSELDPLPVSSQAPKPRAKALLIGIHYAQHVEDAWGTLLAPGKDVKNMYTLLVKRGYNEFRILLDDPGPDCQLDSSLKVDGEPTREQILQGVQWLVEGANDGDRLFLHYSGHGHQIETSSSSESDGYDEAMVPLTKEGEESYIIDNELAAIIGNIKARCTLLALFDCCHSGTMLDLAYKHPRSISKRTLPLPGPSGHTNRPRFNPLNVSRAESMPTKNYKLPTRRNTVLKRTGTVYNLLRLQFGSYDMVPRSPVRKTAVYFHAPRTSYTIGEQAPASFSARQGFSSLTPDRRVWFGDADTTEIVRATSPEPLEPADTQSVREETYGRSHWTRLRKSCTSMGKCHTFSHFHSPVEEEPQHQAKIIAISGCMDSELLFDLITEGGLLTSTFIARMNLDENSEGVPLGEFVNYLSECFKDKTKQVHSSCPPPSERDERCPNPECNLPIIAPQPLFTSSIFLKPDLLIQM